MYSSKFSKLINVSTTIGTQICDRLIYGVIQMLLFMGLYKCCYLWGYTNVVIYGVIQMLLFMGLYKCCYLWGYTNVVIFHIERIMILFGVDSFK